MTRLNWRKGVFRLWVVGSILWVAWAALNTDPVHVWQERRNLIAEGLELSQEAHETEAEAKRTSLKIMQNDVRIAVRTRQLNGALTYIAAPPLIALAFGLVSLWIASGFRSGRD